MEKKLKILIADDDILTRQGLAKVFEIEGYLTVTASNGAEALFAFDRERPDILCLDVMMPGTDGFTVCREIRRKDELVPILFLSAKCAEVDKVVGIELGADDFIVKPFGVREVIARVRTATRRLLAIRKACRCSETHSGQGESSSSFPMRDLVVFPQEMRAKRGMEVIDLSLRETQLLNLFSRHPGQVLGRILIAEDCWGPDRQPTSRTIDQHIAMLRKKIESNPSQPTIIKTIHGVGYRFDP
ncbi:MAG: response regulator transcription factor [Candidatus Ozemobacteraceae bacterium]